MSTVLITGAIGFLGRHCARHFAARGAHVIGIGRGKCSLEQARMWGVDLWIEADVTPESLAKVAPTPDIILHCAGGASVALSQMAPYRDLINSVQTTAAVLDYMRMNAPQAKLVYPSSAAVYGNADSLHLTENTPCIPVSPYGLHKKLSEDLCLYYARAHGLRITVVRFFSLYGPGLPKQLLFDACLKAGSGQYSFFGTGEETRDFLHVRDAASLVHMAVEYAESTCPVVNGASGKSVSVKQLTSLVGSHWPNCPEPAFNGVTREGDPKHLVAHTGCISAWGYTQTISLENGIREYVRWFKEGAQ